MANDIETAIRQICEEKGLSYEAVLETIESALSAAYRKDYGNKMQNIEAEFDTSTGGVRLFDVKTVVEDLSDEEIEKMQEKQAQEAAEREAAEAAADHIRKPHRDEDAQDEAIEDEDAVKFNPKTDIMLRDARVLKGGSEVGDVIRTELPLPGEFGRMAAMTAKQVITQKLREAEREIVFSEFKEQEGEVLIGTVQRREGRIVLVDLGRGVGILLPEDQIPTERYNSGDRMKVYVREVSLGTRGAQIVLTRAGGELVRALFEIEIPEVADGTVEIKAIAREAGARTKIAVISNDESIDPIGACIGQRGVRIQTIINELGGEKIDVIEWSDDPKEFITSALAPAKVKEITLDEAEKMATAIIEEDQLSLAIGRGGQNVRLAARLTGWKVSVRGENEVGGASKEKDEDALDAEVEGSAIEGDEAQIEEDVEDELDIAEVEESLEEDTVDDSLDADPDDHTIEEVEDQIDAVEEEKESIEDEE